MKYILNLTLLFAITFYSGCASKTKEPTLTKTTINLANVTAPRKIGTYELESQKDYQSKNLGIGLRYADMKKKKTFLDCFVYPKKSGETLSNHYNDFKNALGYMAKKGEFKNFEVIKEDEVMLDANTKAKRALFKITNVNTSYYSVAYIAELDKNFFKVRITSAQTSAFASSDIGWNAVRELFKAIVVEK